MKNVIFDFGNVIIQWQPYKAVGHHFDSESVMEATFQEIGFYDWNLEQDRGRSFDDALAAARADRPDHFDVFQSYVDGLHAAHDTLVPGTSELVEKLHAKGVSLFGLTNAARASYDVVRSVAPVISLMQDVVVSGDEQLIKPDPEIFRLCLRRNGLEAAETLFVDDSKANCEGAESVGLAAHHFQGAEGLEQDLRARGLI